MAKINYQTDEWGGNEGELHFELEVAGKTVMIDVDDSKIHINGFFDKCDQIACNAVELIFTANAALTGGPDGPALRGDGRAHPVKRPCPEGALCAPRGGAANEVSAASRARSARDAGVESEVPQRGTDRL